MTILLKKSFNSGEIPDVSEIDFGELAINIPDGKLFLKKSAIEIAEIGGELTKVVDGSNIGWRIRGRNPAYYNAIGAGAIDFSHSTATNVSGASGNYAFATGLDTIASGANSRADGELTQATGINSIATGQGTLSSSKNSMAIGLNTVASGPKSFAAGEYTIASNPNMVALGKYNLGASNTTFLEVGIGQDDYNRKNAFEIYGDGILHAPELSIGLINTGPNKTLVTKEWVGQAASQQRFTDLADTPGNLIGAELKWLRVNDTGTALEYIDGPTATINNLEDLLDVNIPSPIEGDYLRYDFDSAEWISGTPDAIDIEDIADFSIINPQDGEILSFNGSTNTWVNLTGVDGGLF